MTHVAYAANQKGSNTKYAGSSKDIYLNNKKVGSFQDMKMYDVGLTKDNIVKYYYCSSSTCFDSKHNSYGSFLNTANLMSSKDGSYWMFTAVKDYSGQILEVLVINGEIRFTGPRPVNYKHYTNQNSADNFITGFDDLDQPYLLVKDMTKGYLLMDVNGQTKANLGKSGFPEIEVNNIVNAEYTILRNPKQQTGRYTIY